jgi:hypothetical protein
MGSIVSDYWASIAMGIALLSAVTSQIVGLIFKDSLPSKIILLSASLVFGVTGVAGNVYSTYESGVSAKAERDKRSAMKELLHGAIKDGELLSAKTRTESDSDVNAYEDDFESWSGETAKLVEDAYGDSERDIFESYAGVQLMSVPNHPLYLTASKIGARMQRLNDLIRRADTIAMQPGFDPHNYHPK